MDENPGPFIELATRPLEKDPTTREIAEAELFARIAHTQTHPGDDTIAEATARLAATKPATPRRLPLVIAGGFLLLSASIAMLLPKSIADYRVLGGFHRGFNPGKFASQLQFIADQGQALWLHPPPLADLQAWRNNSSELPAKMEPLIAAQPDDPALYHEYARRYIVGHGRVPPGYRETWTRINPGNALWPLLEATAAARAALGYDRTVIADSAAMDLVLASFKEAAGMPRFRDHGTTLSFRQLAAFPPPAGLAEARIRWLYGKLPRSVNWSINADDAIRLKLSDLAATGDRAGFNDIVADADRIIRLLYDDIETDDSAASTALFEARDFKELEKSYRSSGEVDAAKAMNELSRICYPLTHIVPFNFHGYEAVPESLFQDHFPGARSYSPDLGGDPFRARRLAEYALADRFASLALGIIATLSLPLVALAAFCRRGGPGTLGCGLQPLFRPSDHGWMLGLGLIAPLLFWFGIVHFSPLGCRDQSWMASFRKAMRFIPWLPQVIGLYLLVGTCMFQTVRWRWSKRGAFFSLRPGWLAAGWVMPLLAALAIPAVGLVRYWPAQTEKILMIAASLAGIPLLWLLWHTAAILFAPRAGALRAILTARSLLPWTLAFAALLVAGVPLMQARERHWMAEDWKNEIDVTQPHASRFKGPVGKEIRRQVMEALDR